MGSLNSFLPQTDCRATEWTHPESPLIPFPGYFNQSSRLNHVFWGTRLCRLPSTISCSPWMLFLLLLNTNFTPPPKIMDCCNLESKVSNRSRGKLQLPPVAPTTLISYERWIFGVIVHTGIIVYLHEWTSLHLNIKIRGELCSSCTWIHGSECVSLCHKRMARAWNVKSIRTSTKQPILVR